MRLTKRFWGWLVGCIIIFIVINFNLVSFAHILMVFWLCLPVISLFFLALQVHFLKSIIEPLTPYVTREEEASWQIILKYKLLFRLYDGYIVINQQENPLIFNQEGQANSLVSVRTKHAGYLKMPSIDLIIVSEFGFFKVIKKLERQHNQVLVLPKVYVPSELSQTLDDFLESHGRQIIKHHLMKDEFNHVDNLRPEEPLRHVHWKLSARHQRFIVNRYQPPQSQQAHLWAHLTGPNMFHRDVLLDMMSYVSDEWLRRGYQLKFNDHSETSLLSARSLLSSLNHENTSMPKSFDHEPLLMVVYDVDDHLREFLATKTARKEFVSLIVIGPTGANLGADNSYTSILKVNDYVKI